MTNIDAKSGESTGLMDRPITLLIAALLALAALAVIFWGGLAYMVSEWSQEEYSHGYLIPVIALLIALQQRKALTAERLGGSWSGVWIIVLGLAAFLLGELSSIYAIIQYAFLICLFGLCVALFGWRRMKYLWVPLVYLAFMIPLPDFLYNNLSSKLQLISSQIGVAVIRAMDVSVYLEGNVIDLGVYQLQVVEACSGLRYLFPLMSFGFLCAYLFKAPFWQRALVFLATIPLTVFMNSFRIGVIGVLVDRYGIEQAEGFLHDFEGWIIFMACVALLFLLMLLLMKLTGDKRRLNQAFGVEFGDPAEPGALGRLGGAPRQFAAALALLVVGAIGASAVTERQEILPGRQTLAAFPLSLDDWRGRSETVEPQILNSLNADDYLSANFVEEGASRFVNLWVAYYESQRKGSSIHSPRACLPGGGWRIQDLSQVAVEGLEMNGKPLMVNRVLIALGDQRQLVYYWYQQRGRNITNEYLLKWFIFWDGLTRNRTDGALVRLTSVVAPGADPSAADGVLTEFAHLVLDKVPVYVPD